MSAAASPLKTVQQKALDKVQQENIDAIMAEARGNLEVQVLLLSTIKDWKAQKDGTAAAPKRKNKSAQFDDSGDDSGGRDDAGPPFEIDQKLTLGRSGTRYAAWKKALFLELFHYCGGRRWNPAKKLLDSLPQLQQVFEYSFDLNISDPTRRQDRSVQTNKKATFEALAALHEAHGRRLLSIDVRDGAVEWTKQGCFSVVDTTQKDGARRIVVTDRFANRVANLPEYMLSDCQDAPLTNDNIMMKYSYQGAYLKINASDKFECHNLFPRAKRQLVRRMSDDVGASVAMETGGPPKKNQGKRTGSGSDESSTKKQKVGSSAAPKNAAKKKTTQAAAKLRDSAPPPSPTGDQASAAGTCADGAGNEVAAGEEQPESEREQDGDSQGESAEAAQTS